VGVHKKPFLLYLGDIIINMDATFGRMFQAVKKEKLKGQEYLNIE